MTNDVVQIDRAFDEVLMNVGGVALILSSPLLTRTAEEHQALVRSVSQFSLCAGRSANPRVRRLAKELKDAIRPHLHLVVSR